MASHILRGVAIAFALLLSSGGAASAQQAGFCVSPNTYQGNFYGRNLSITVDSVAADCNIIGQLVIDNRTPVRFVTRTDNRPGKPRLPIRGSDQFTVRFEQIQRCGNDMCLVMYNDKPPTHGGSNGGWYLRIMLTPTSSVSQRAALQ